MKKRRRRDEDKGMRRGMSREERVCVGSGVGDEEEEGTKGASPLYFRSESITMNGFWYRGTVKSPGGRQVGSEKRGRSDE